MSTMRETLLRDMDEMFWLELERVAPDDSLVQVSAELELLDVAEQIALDNTDQIKAWMEAGKVRRPEDEDRERWAKAHAKFLCVIVKPFVLMQEIVPQA